MVIFPLSKRLWTGIIAVGVLIYLFIESGTRGDFHIFLAASTDLFDQKDIYHTLYFTCYHYYYSILFAILIYPLTFLNSQVALFLWLLLNVFFIYRIVKFVTELLPLNVLSKKQQMWFWLFSFLFSIRLLMENFHVAQMTICLLYLTLEGFLLIQKDKTYSGAFLIALGINIKLLPLVILPYLLYRGKIKASLLIILFYAVLLFLPILFIGKTQFDSLISSWAELINPLNKQHLMDVSERSFHSLSTFLSVLLIEKAREIDALPLKRNIADISLQSLYTVILCCRLTLAAFTLYFLKTMPFQKSLNLLHQFWELSYILLVVPLLFPHQQHYAFLFMIPAFMYCAYYLLAFKDQKSKIFIYVTSGELILIYFAVNLKLLLGEFNPYYEHFKILTYGALLLIVVLATLQPKRKVEI
ncbi:MAG: glycosyltransferase family 87 protein [Bacteroidota bacterium]